MSVPRTPFGEREAHLLARAQGGDRAAWNDLVICYQPEIERVCFYVLRHHEDTEDARNQTFLKAQLALDRFKGGSLGAWLTTIARNTCADELRKRRRRDRTIKLIGGAQETLALLDFLSKDAALDQFREEERLREGRALADAVARVLDTLAPLEASLVRLHVMEGMPMRRIAARLGRSEGDLRDKVYRALRNLRHPRRSHTLRDFL
jgi:RNA polymerase sigma-70 factor, ECF subfamily